jgi:hypothetical protein
MKAEFEYKLISDLDINLEEFIAGLIEKLILIAEKLEDNYFDISDSRTKVEVEVKT